MQIRKCGYRLFFQHTKASLPIHARRYSKKPAEHLRIITLSAKTAPGSNLPNGAVGIQQQLLAFFQTIENQIINGRLAHISGENLAAPASADLAGRSDIGKGYI